MPVGILVDCAGVAVGGLIGTLCRRALAQRLRENMPLMFGICAMAMGVASIVRAVDMAIVVAAALVGFALGHLLGLDERVQRGAQGILAKFVRGGTDEAMLLCAFTAFCCSGLGWYGSIMEAISQDASVLISKAILDCFTALIFATTLKLSVCLLAIPQFATMMVVYAAGLLLKDAVSARCLENLCACGGIITLAVGLRMAKVLSIPTVDMAPALAFALLFTAAAACFPVC